MGLLTGKALADFNMWVKDYEVGFIEMEPRNAYVMYNDLYEEQQLPIIIEWLDSVGLFVNVYHDFNGIFFFNVDNNDSTLKSNFGTCNYNNRHEATQKAIIHANKIYNER